MTQRPTPLPGLEKIAPYVPGKSGTGPAHKLSANESALGPSPAAMEAYRSAASRLHIYPDGAARSLREAIAQVHGLTADQLIIGSGSDEIIQLLIRGYAAPGDHIIQSAHGFSYYAIAAEAARVGTVLVPEDGLTADVDALAAAATDRTRLVFLANPNSPTGTLLGRAAIRRLREALPPPVILVLDGAYAEYVTDEDFTDGADLVAEAEASGAGNVIMMRTFSKIYGLGGLRVGWGYAPRHLIDILNRIRPPFNVTAPALVAAEAAVRDRAFVEENRAFTVAERTRMADGLEAMGFAVIRGHANFVLADAGDIERASVLLVALEERGIMVRSAASSGLPAHLRISVGPKGANDALLLAMTSLAEG